MLVKKVIKNAPVLSVTDEEDIAGPNAGSEDDAEEKKTSSASKKRKKELSDVDDVGEEFSDTISDMLGQKISKEQMRKLMVKFAEKQDSAKLSPKQAKKEKAARGKRTKDVTFPELPSVRATRASKSVSR